MKAKDEYMKSLAAELKKWSTQIYIMIVRSQNAAVYARLKYDEELFALRAKQHDVAEKIKALKDNQPSEKLSPAVI